MWNDAMNLQVRRPASLTATLLLGATFNFMSRVKHRGRGWPRCWSQGDCCRKTKAGDEQEPLPLTTLRRCVVVLADQTTLDIAIGKHLNPTEVTESLLEVGSLSVDSRWHGHSDELFSLLGQAVPTSDFSLDDVWKTIRPSRDGSILNTEALGLLWYGARWDVIWVGDGMNAALQDVAKRTFGAQAAFAFQEVPMMDDDWVSAVQESPPQLLGRVAVVHTMHGHDEVEAALASCTPDPLLLTLELGPGFGFGDHPTTRLCAEWLQAQKLEGSSVLDFGCGTGVLALIALRLGAESAVGVDCDLVSLFLAQANAARNGLPLELFAAQEATSSDWPCVSFFSPSSQMKGKRLFLSGPPRGRRFDVVIANILPDVLVRIAPRISASLAPGGQLILSGFRVHQFKEVRKAFLLQGLDLELHAVMPSPGVNVGTWICVTGRAPLHQRPRTTD